MLNEGQPIKGVQFLLFSKSDSVCISLAITTLYSHMCDSTTIIACAVRTVIESFSYECSETYSTEL